MKKYIRSSWGRNYRDYDGWDEADIELHKSIDWAARNYDEYPVPEDSFEGYATLYTDDWETVKLPVTFIKYIRANPIYPPYYRAEDLKPFDSKSYGSYVGPMYDGNHHGAYDVHDRYEGSRLYDQLSR